MENMIMLFEGHNVEVLELDGKVLFNPYHVGECLDIIDINSSIRGFNGNQVIKLRNSDMHDMHIRKLNNAGENFLTESGVYKLIFKSHKPDAEKFQDWVTDEVLPAIRRHGIYAVDDLLNNPDLAIKAFTALKEERNKCKLLENQIKQQKPLVEFANQVTKTQDSIDMGQMAKLIQDENINIGRNRLFEYLRANKILMQNNIPYQKYIDNNWFRVIETVNPTLYGDKIFCKTLVNPKGQIGIVEILRKDYANDLAFSM